MNNDKKSKKYPPNTRLLHAREERGWSQKELADKVGTTLINVCRWEKGKTFPSSYFRQRIQDVFGKSLADLGLIPPPLHSSQIGSIPNTHSPYFIGREDLLALLHKRLTITRTAALTQAQALYGLGGIGKTQTAAEYAFRYGNDYTHVFWVRAATRETLIADFVALAQQLDLSEKDVRNQFRIVTAVKRWLADNNDWLLILDNADDLPLAQSFLPSNHSGYILFTTRAQAAGTLAENIEVQPLNVQDARLLLLRQSKLLKSDASLDDVPSDLREAAERIVKEMGGLPLALVQVAAYIEETGCSLTDYLDLYATHRKELLAYQSSLLLDYPETVDTTWLLSFHQIEQQSPAAADVLNLCAFLAPDGIPEDLFTHGAAELGTLPGAVVVDAHKLNGVLKVLGAYSLVRRNNKTHMLTIHRLVQTVLKEHMSQETQRAWAERTVRLVNAAFPEEDYGTGTNHQYYLQYYLPHIEECATLIEHHHLSFPEAAQLLYKAGAFLYACGLYSQSEALHQQALSIREQVVGTDHPATADSFNYLAMLSRLRGNNEQAERFHRQALLIREKVLGPEHPATLQSLNNLGVLYRNQGKYEQAKSLLQKAFNICIQSLGSGHPNTLTTILSLAKLYLEQKKYEQAEQFLKQSLAGFERTREFGHPLIAQSFHLLARLSCEQGQHEQAEVLWQRAIALIENTLGSENPAIAESLNGLAELYVAQGRYREAESLYQRVLTISEKTLGSEHIDTLTYRKHLIDIMSKRKEA